MPITERGPTKGPTKVPFQPRAVPKSPPTAPTPRHTHTKLLHESARPGMSFSMGFPARGLAGPAPVSPRAAGAGGAVESCWNISSGCRVLVTVAMRNIQRWNLLSQLIIDEGFRIFDALHFKPFDL